MGITSDRNTVSNCHFPYKNGAVLISMIVPYGGTRLKGLVVLPGYGTAHN